MQLNTTYDFLHTGLSVYFLHYNSILITVSQFACMHSEKRNHSQLCSCPVSEDNVAESPLLLDCQPIPRHALHFLSYASVQEAHQCLMNLVDVHVGVFHCRQNVRVQVGL